MRTDNLVQMFVLPGVWCLCSDPLKCRGRLSGECRSLSSPSRGWEECPRAGHTSFMEQRISKYVHIQVISPLIDIDITLFLVCDPPRTFVGNVTILTFQTTLDSQFKAKTMLIFLCVSVT